MKTEEEKERDLLEMAERGGLPEFVSYPDAPFRARKIINGKLVESAKEQLAKMREQREKQPTQWENLTESLRNATVTFEKASTAFKEFLEKQVEPKDEKWEVYISLGYHKAFCKDQGDAAQIADALGKINPDCTYNYRRVE